MSPLGAEMVRSQPEELTAWLEALRPAVGQVTRETAINLV
jgi:hypothetical protein